MALRIPWDKYEVAILINAGIKVNNKEIARNKAVKQVSQTLRQRAIKNGVEIDDVFRNENGISMQLNIIVALLQDRKSGLHNASKLFYEMVDLYRNDYNSYNIILKEAMELADINSKEEFMNYITQVSPEKLNDTIKAMTYIDEFALSPKILGHSIFDDLSDDTIEIIQKKILNNKFFDIKYSKQKNIIRSSMVLLEEYVNNMMLDTSLVSSNDVIVSTANETSKKDFLNENSKEERQPIETLNLRLKSMAKVYDDPNGFNISRIRDMLGISVDIEELRRILDDADWVTEIEKDIYSFSKFAKAKEKNNVYDKDSIVKVLMLRYQNGMRFDSIDLENFRATFSDIIGEDLSNSDEELETILRNCGVVYKERLFPAEGIVSSTVKEKLLEYIENNIANGKRVLYYKAILEDLSDVFSYCYNLSDPEMLKPYLEYVCESDKYYFYPDYLSADENAKIDPKSEIENYLLSVGKPLSYDEIYEGLSHISKDIIYNAIKSNPHIILNEKEHYYHYDIFEFSYEDSDMISKYIDDEIEEEGYCIWTHVFSKIQDTMPLFIENNAYLSPLGIRNAISRKLAGRFNFNGEVVSHFGYSLNMSDVYRLYGEHHAPFSDIDIYEFSKMVSNGVIYFDALSETCVRVSKNLFVPKTDVAFDIEATDKAISTYLTTGYMLVKDIDSFLVFPNVGYEWNEYLLESYLLFYSSKYALLNNGRSLNNVAGAVISKNGEFSNFADVCADILANSECLLTKQNSLNFLAEMNLITKKSYSKIESVISIAKQIRNRKV